MPRLLWYKMGEKPDDVSFSHAYTRREQDSGRYEVGIPYDDPVMEPHLALSHEIAHIREGHFDFDEPEMSQISTEIAATERTIEQLMSGGEWTRQAKDSLTSALSSYISGEDAKWWMDRLEKRARKKLGRDS